MIRTSELRWLLGWLLLVCTVLTQLFALTHCATPSPPRGGPVDSIGPVLVAEESTPNYRTNFRPDEIELTFDEWVELDFQQPILTSPPLDLSGDRQPRLERRTLVIPLDGVDYLDSVTYVINIGTAIKDLNEGNPTENLRFVFATGPELDTASVSGKVVDAYTGEPVAEAALTLYGNLADTAVFTENPTYFARTDEEGDFEISNVKPGPYRVVALLRNPGARNYFADFGGVFPPLATGFVDSIVTVEDGANELGAVRLSEVPVPPRIAAAITDIYGTIKIAVNQAAENVDLYTERDYLRSNVGDTLRLYYRAAAADTLILGRDSTFTDTLFVTGEEAGDAPLGNLRLLGGNQGRENPKTGVRLPFNRPIDTIDRSLIQVYEDTLPEPVRFTVEADTVGPAELILRGGFDPELPYRVEVLPGAVTDWYGLTNVDTLIRDIRVAPVGDFGDLTIVLDNLIGTASYIMRLVNAEGQVITGTRRFIEKRFDYTVTYLGLSPDTYRLELIYDSNHNQRFDPGDLRFGQTPEVVRRFEIEPLRANWEVEKIIDLANN